MDDPCRYVVTAILADGTVKVNTVNTIEEAADFVKIYAADYAACIVSMNVVPIPC